MKINDILRLPMLGVYRENSKHALMLDSLCGGSLVYLELKSLLSNISIYSLRNKDKLVNYINNGTRIISVQLDEYDCFTHEYIGSDCSIMTDGYYRWMPSLAYYINQYNLVMPTDFIERAIRANNIECGVK